MYGLTLLSPPLSEPVSVQEAKEWARVDGSNDDNAIASNIIAARLYCEKVLGRALVAQTWLMTLDRFPSGTVNAGRYRRAPSGGYRLLAGSALWPEAATIHLPKAPLLDVLSVKYIDANGNLATVDPSIYVVDTSHDPGRIAPTFGNYWPVIRYQLDAVRITFVAGYGPVGNIPLGVSAGTQTVTPTSMSGIYAGSTFLVDPGVNQEFVVVSSVTGSTFTATFQNSHPAGCLINSTPELVRKAMLLLVAHWYENREAVLPGQVTSVPMAVDSLLGAEWNGEY